MTGHTKEPCTSGTAFPEMAKSGAQFADCDSEETAEEIVAAMNALAGMNPAALGALIEAAEKMLELEFWGDESKLEGDELAIVPATVCRDIRTALANLRGGAQ